MAGEPDEADSPLSVDGAPVKVAWTREDDVRHGFYHTVTAERLEAGLDQDNKVVAWRHRSAAPSLFANFMPDPKYPQFIELGMGFVDTPFNVSNVRLESGEAQSHLRVGWFRSVNNVAHAWAIQSFIAEIAHELGRDPKDMLLELIGPARIVEAPEKATTPWWDYGEPHEVYPVHTARLRRVTELVAEKAGWARSRQLSWNRDRGQHEARDQIPRQPSNLITPQGREKPRWHWLGR